MEAVPIPASLELKLHETGHAVLPWQRDIYAVIEDCSKSLDSQIADQFDREANVFASEVLFQLDGFGREAADSEFGIRVPLKLCRKYGASIYATVRRYVSKNTRACLVLVVNPPEIAGRHGFTATLRRVVASPLFIKMFGDMDWPAVFTPADEIGAMIPLGGRKMSRPREILLVDPNGVRHQCIAEAFTQTHQVFILIHAVRTMTKATVMLANNSMMR